MSLLPLARSLATLFAIAPLLAAAQAQAPANADDEALQSLAPVSVEDSRLADRPAGGRRLDEKGIAAARTGTSDTARMLEEIPGVSSYGAGGISSLPAIHGLADDRLRTQVDGMDLAAACPNHMNPALSFIDPTRIAAIEVYAGIAPVSLGGDSIGGTIQVKSAPPKFAGENEDIFVAAQAGGFYRSNGHAHGDNLGATIAGRQLNVSYNESRSSSDNYRAADVFKKPGLWKTLGERPIDDKVVAASEYGGALNRDLGVALRLNERHLLEFNIAKQQLDYEGFPNQRMDMVQSVPTPDDPTLYELKLHRPANVNRTLNLRYTGQYEWGELETRFFRQDVRHHMDMLQDRFFGMYMPMDTEAETRGGLLKASIDLGASDILRIGADFQNYRLDDWWPKIGDIGSSMCCNTFWNVRDGKRDRRALFAEWESRWSDAWSSQLGVRRGTVHMQADPVQGYNATYAADALRFNAGPREHTDRHLDYTALARFVPSATQSYEAGFARKTRSPNLYERYSWSYNPMAALMNNFVGDGNAYIGNASLKPEIARTFSVTGDWHDAEKSLWGVKLTAYVTRVADFITAERCPRSISAQCSALNSSTTNRYVLLRYANHEAKLYGADLSGQRELGSIEGVGGFAVNASMAYVRGRDRSTGDDLYHIMPLSSKLALAHRLGGWTNTAEVAQVRDKSHASQVRNEVQTDGYTLVNLRSSYEWKYARLDLELENAFDKFYLQPLGGAYVGQGNSMTTNAIPWGMTVPGRGRSLNVAINLHY